MYESINIAMSGMNAQQNKIDVISNNLANINTPGFKKSGIQFEDLMSKEVQFSKSLFTRAQTSSYVGMGTSVSSVNREFTQGDVSITGRQLDIAIQGEGFLEILLPDGMSAYTRSGSLKLNSDGFFCNADGYVLRPSIRAPEGVESILIQSDGAVLAMVGGKETPELLGKIELANFMNPAALQPIGDNLYVVSEQAGPAYFSDPGENGLGTLQQGAVEQSNVDLVQEMTGLLMAQRGYELNAQVIQTTNSILEVINSLSR